MKNNQVNNTITTLLPSLSFSPSYSLILINFLLLYYLYLDAQGSFEAIVSILYTLNDVNSIQQIVNLFVEKLTNNKTEKTTLRLKILVVLFNLLTLVETKLTLLKGNYYYLLYLFTIFIYYIYLLYYLLFF